MKISNLGFRRSFYSIVFFLEIIFSTKVNCQTAEEYYNKSLNEAGQNNYFESIKLLDIAIRLNPKNSNYYIERAFAKDYLNNSVGALADYSKAIKINNPSENIFLAYLNRAKIKKNNNSFKEAIRDCDTSIQLNSGYSDSYLIRGACFSILKNDKLAMSDYNRAIEINFPASVLPRVYLLRSQIKENYEDYRGAISDLDKTIELDSEIPISYIKRAHCYVMLNDNEKAILDYNKAIELEPKNGDYYYLRGLTEIILGKKDMACSDLSKAGELGSIEAYKMIKKYCNN